MIPDPTSSTKDRIMDRLKRSWIDRVVTPKDFLDLGTRATVDQTLRRLVNDGVLSRVGRGLYHYMRVNPKLGVAPPPSPGDIAIASGRQVGSSIVPSGTTAANMLGLTTQVGGTNVYYTDGASRTVPTDLFTIKLKHVARKDLPVASPKSTTVIQALRFLGRGGIDDRAIRTLRGRLSIDERRQLASDARYATDWIADAARRVAADDSSPASGAHDG